VKSEIKIDCLSKGYLGFKYTNYRAEGAEVRLTDNKIPVD